MVLMLKVQTPSNSPFPRGRKQTTSSFISPPWKGGDRGGLT